MNSTAKGGVAAAAAIIFAIPLLVVVILSGTVTDCDPADTGGSGGTTASGGNPGHKTMPMKKGTYQLTSPFGPRDGTMHQGQDFGSTPGQPIYAAYDGTVSKSGPASGFGQWIVLSHNLDGKRYDTVYGHMFPQDLMVHVGQKVTAGQQIAKVGYNGEVSPPGPGGAHLHFEVWEGGWGQHVIDPMPWLRGAAEPGSAPPPATGGDSGGGSGDPNVVSVADWNKVAQYESGGNWAINTGNGYYGGLQFAAGTWSGSGGTKYAATADKATPAQQMEVANSVLKSQGWGAWPVTSVKAGVTSKKPAPAGTFVNSSVPARAPPAADAPEAGAAAPSTPGPGSDLAGGITDSDGALDVSKPMPARLGSETHWQTNTVRLARAVAQRFPQLKTIGGWRPYDPYPDHPSGAAADIMMPNGGHTPGDVDLGTRIQKYVMDNKNVFHVKYTIWRQYYQPADGAGNTMEDRGGWTANHFDHVHVTLNDSPLYHGEDLGSVRDRGGAGLGSGDTGSGCDGDTEAAGQAGNPNATNVRGVPREWAQWYNKAGRICPQISPSLLAAQGNQETGGFQQHVQSPDAAKGPAQFIDSTWATYGKDYDGDGRVDVYSLGDAIMAQGHFMCDLAKQIDGWIAAGQVDEHSGPDRDRRDLYLAAYNAGPGAVQSSHGFPNQIPRHFTETRPYAQRIITSEPQYRGPLDDANAQAQ